IAMNQPMMSRVLPDQYSYATKRDENPLLTHVVIAGKFEELILLYLSLDENASEDRIEI
ncbi:hypothetical protein K0M31_001841, partial [Melipona bicolor]